jgi:uncharacterized cupredoxin-like copper-binding protein
MKKMFITGSLLALAILPAWASGSGDHTHDLAIGVPGDAAQVKRTINITMKETQDGKMLFSPASLTVREGETLRIKFVNRGETDHEFVMDTVEAILEHKELMQKFPEMEHDDPNAIRLQPDGKGEIIWTFGKAGDYAFGCLIPGHYEAGMKGVIKISR